MRHLWRCKVLLLAGLAGAVPTLASAQGTAEKGAPALAPAATPARAPTIGDTARPPASPAPADKPAQIGDQLKVSFNGVFNTWFQRQQNFFLGRADYSDRYVVQMLRLGLTFGWGDNIRAVTRFDMAQGWWGTDNANYRDEYNANGNASSRWASKDTKYPLHVDYGYLEFKFPATPLTARMGRMYYGLGNKIILDSNFDGMQVDAALGSSKLNVGWAKVSEGGVSLNDFEAANPGSGGIDGRDANLFMASFAGKAGGGALNYSLYGLYYNDGNSVPYLPNRLDYNIHRFASAVSSANAIGLSASYDVKSLKLRLDGEGDYLTGKDKLARTNSLANQLLDVNNGDLSGYNLFARVTKTLSPKAELAVLVGRGSGDGDVMSGKGNLTKLKTMGFFYLTDVWEQSIMPDEEGITPQGLGAPNIRGYRELENTTILQANTTLKPTLKFRLHGEYSIIRATQPIHGWDRTTTNGVITAANMSALSSQNIGKELAGLVGYAPYNRLDLVLRGGYLWAGDGARLLINGNTTGTAANPWQLKAMVEFRFDNATPARVASR